MSTAASRPRSEALRTAWPCVVGQLKMGALTVEIGQAPETVVKTTYRATAEMSKCPVQSH